VSACASFFLPRTLNTPKYATVSDCSREEEANAESDEVVKQYTDFGGMQPVQSPIQGAVNGDAQNERCRSLSAGSIP